MGKYLFRVWPVFFVLIFADTACNRPFNPVTPIPPVSTNTPNATPTLPVTMTVSPSATAPVSLTPTGSVPVTPTATDTYPVTQTATWTPTPSPTYPVTFTPTPTPSAAGFVLTKSESNASLASGQAVTYYLYLTQGGAPVTGAVLSDTVPAGIAFSYQNSTGFSFGQNGNLLTWSFPGPVSNASATVNWVGFAATDCSLTGPVTNIASITAPGMPPVESNPVVAFLQCSTATGSPTPIESIPVSILLTATPTSAVTQTATWTPTPSPTTPVTFTPTSTPPAAGFVLTKSESATFLSSGQDITYYLFYSQNGVPVSNAVLNDTVPAGVSFAYQGASGLSFGRNGSLLTWSFPGPVSDASGVVTWVGMADCSATGPVTNIASITASGMAPVFSNPVVARIDCSTATATPTSTAPTTLTPAATATLPATQTGTPTWTPTPLSCAQTAVWGDSVTMGYGVTIYGGNTYCQKYALGQNSVVNQVHFDIISYNYTGSMAVGIYTDGGSQPSGLVWNSDLQSVAAGWNAIGVPQVQLAAGNYWLALYSDNYVMLASDSASTSAGTWEPLEFPNPFLNPAGPFPTPTGTPPAGGYGPPPSQLSQSPAAIYADICY